MVRDVDDPRHGVGRKKIRIPFHSALPPGSSSDCMACASSTSRDNFSSRYRDQQTRNAKQENASQLISRACICADRSILLRPSPAADAGSEKPDRKINKRHATAHPEPPAPAQQGCLSAGRKSPQKQITHVDQPQHQRRRQPHVPRHQMPHTDAPRLARDQHDRAENDAHVRHTPARRYRPWRSALIR